MSEKGIDFETAHTDCRDAFEGRGGLKNAQMSLKVPAARRARSRLYGTIQNVN